MRCMAPRFHSIPSAAGGAGGQVDGAAGVLLRLHHAVAGGQQRGVHAGAPLLPDPLRSRLLQVRGLHRHDSYFSHEY